MTPGSYGTTCSPLKHWHEQQRCSHSELLNTGTATGSWAFPQDGSSPQLSVICGQCRVVNTWTLSLGCPTTPMLSLA